VEVASSAAILPIALEATRSILPNGRCAVWRFRKGRDAGGKWSAVLDFSAALMTLVSLTGLTLIFFLNQRRWFGLTIAAMGALLCYLAYAIWVS
jgi:hypothetical protein